MVKAVNHRACPNVEPCSLHPAPCQKDRRSWVGVVARACYPNTWEVEARGSGIEGHPWPHSELKVRITENKIDKGT